MTENNMSSVNPLDGSLKLDPWTGYVSKAEAEELAGEIGSLRVQVKKLQEDNKFLLGFAFWVFPPSALVWILFLLVSLYGLVDFFKFLFL